MSASEKLKALDEQAQSVRAAFPGPGLYDEFVLEIFDALPQIVAVVEAAAEASDWISQETSGFGHGGEVMDRVDAALAALDEALS